MIRTTSLLAFTLTTMICWVGKTQAGELEERGLAQHPIGRQVGQIGAINGPDDWCMFLPPKAGGGIAPHEVDARAFCNRKQANAPGAKLFPPGFIRSTHFVKTKTYVQITGQFNRKAYELSQKDSGGQYDMKAPVGSIVTGFKRFVNMVEPDNEIYCIRACIEKDKKLCDTFHSERGCRALIGGNYGPNQSKAVKSSSKPHRKPTRTIVETNDVAPSGGGNKDTRTRPNPTRKPHRPTPAATPDTVPTQPVTVCETETKTKTKTRTRTTISVETTTYTKHHETTLTVTKYLPPLPTDIPNFPSLPKPESPTILIRNSPPNHESRPPVVTSAVSGCHDLYPEGLLFWNTTVSTAMVFIPGDMAVRIEFYVQENCTRPSVLNLERDTLSTHRSTIVDVLPDFFGNYLGPQSVNVRVEM